MGDKIDVENVDELGFAITCKHLKKDGDREKFGNIPLEHSADMAVCKRCYVKLTPADVVEDQGIDVPEGVEPGELLDGERTTSDAPGCTRSKNGVVPPESNAGDSVEKSGDSTDV